MKLIAEYNDLKAIADSIREKTSTTDEMSIYEMPSLIRGIENGVALPQLDNPAAAADILINKQAIDEAGQKLDGSMPIVELATPTITFSSAGTITAKVTQGTSGYLEAGTKIATDYLDTKEASTYGAKTTDQTISAKQYLVGAQTIKKVEQSGLSAANIIKGKTVTISSNGSNLWSVTGTGANISPTKLFSTELNGKTYTYISTVAGTVIAMFAFQNMDNDASSISVTTSAGTITELSKHYKVRGSSSSNYSNCLVGVYLIKNLTSGATITFTGTPAEEDNPICLIDIIQL